MKLDKKRITKQVRIHEKWHEKLKDVAREENMTISRFIDRILKGYFYSKNRSK